MIERLPDFNDPVYSPEDGRFGTLPDYYAGNESEGDNGEPKSGDNEIPGSVKLDTVSINKNTSTNNSVDGTSGTGLEVGPLTAPSSKNRAASIIGGLLKWLRPAVLDVPDIDASAPLATGIVSLQEVPRSLRTADGKLPPRVLKPEAPSLTPDHEKDRARLLAETAGKTILPITEALRADPKYAHHFTPEALAARDVQALDPGRLERTQRPLTSFEREYVNDVVSLTSFNPYEVLAGQLAPEFTEVNLKAHFDRVVEESRNELAANGNYAPIFVLGTGIHAVNAASAILRHRPDLLKRIYFLDRAEYPGGPAFTGPNGEAFGVNSASPTGDEPFALSAASLEPGAENTIRAAGSPFRGNPGERDDDITPRRKTINRIGGFWQGPEQFAPGLRYVTNNLVGLDAQEQAALAIHRFINRSDVPRVTASGRPTGSGDKLIQVQETGLDGTVKTVSYYTDIIIDATGSGDHRNPVIGTTGYEEVLEAQQDMTGLPLVCTSQDAWRFLADRSQEQPSYGKTIMLVGDSDSALAMAKKLGGQIQTGQMQPLDKLYIIGREEDFSQRRVYAEVKDLLSRDGRTNVLECIDERWVGVELVQRDEFGVRFDNQAVAADEVAQNQIVSKRVIAYGLGGAITSEETGIVPEVDHLINCTGYMSKRDERYKTFLDDNDINGLTDYAPLLLPKGFDIAVGERVTRQNIFFTGTAASPRFSAAKRAQYNQRTQRVLNQFGENALSIGLIGPDVDAAVPLFLDEIKGLLPPQAVPETAPKILSESRMLKAGKELKVRADTIKPRDLIVSLESDETLLKSLMLTPMTSSWLDTPRKQRDTPERRNYRMSFGYEPQADSGETLLVVKSHGKTPLDVASEVAAAAGANRFFSHYAQAAIKQRQGATSLAVNMAYVDGRLDIQNSMVQAA